MFIPGWTEVPGKWRCRGHGPSQGGSGSREEPRGLRIPPESAHLTLPHVWASLQGLGNADRFCRSGVESEIPGS